MVYRAVNSTPLTAEYLHSNKLNSCRSPTNTSSSLGILTDQAGELLAGKITDLVKKADNNTFLSLLERQRVKANYP